MQDPDLIELSVKPLNDLGARYLVSGSVAAMLYGEPRVTHDIDLVVFLRTEQIQQLAGAYPTPEFYVPPIDTIRARRSRNQRSTESWQDRIITAKNIGSSVMILSCHDSVWLHS